MARARLTEIKQDLINDEGAVLWSFVKGEQLEYPITLQFLSDSTYKSGGRLQLGTTSANGILTVLQAAGKATFDSNGSYFTIELASGGSRRAFYGYNEGTGQWQLNNVTAGGTEQSVLLYDRTNAYLSFGTNGTERARIDSSGNLLVGQTTPSGLGSRLDVVNGACLDGDVYLCRTGGNLLIGTSTTDYDVEGLKYRNDLGTLLNTSTSNTSLFLNRRGTTGVIVDLYQADTNVGNISVTGSATSYNTSSDYRLKNITGAISNSGAYIDSLNPVEGTWKADGSTFVGLIAHEVQEVSRTPVATGVKDGEEMQAMDYSSSELIANMIAELKSLRARVAQLEQGN